MRAMAEIPYFVDHTSAVQNINRLRRLLKEREMWDANRTEAQRVAHTTFKASQSMLNNWLTQRLLSESAQAVTLRNEIDEGTRSFDDNANKVIEMFERLERDKTRDNAMRMRHAGGATTGSWNVSFAAKDDTRSVHNSKLSTPVQMSSETSTRCYKCRKPGHTAEACRVESSRLPTCFVCGGKGHYKRECPNLKAITETASLSTPAGIKSPGEYKRPWSGVTKFSSPAKTSKSGMVLIRNSDGSPRAKIPKDDFHAYRCHLEDSVEMYRGLEDVVDEEDDEVVLTREEEECHEDAERRMMGGARHD